MKAKATCLNRTAEPILPVDRFGPAFTADLNAVFTSLPAKLIYLKTMLIAI